MINQSQLCNIVNNAKCCVGDKALELLDKDRKGHSVDCCFEELMWMSRAIKILENHIPVGTLESEPAVSACGLTNSEVGFAPIDLSLTTNFDVIVFDYNGNPLIPPASETSITDMMDDIIAALTAASGVTWGYTQVGDADDFEFFLCAPYTQNGDTVELNIQVSQEGILGNIRMAATLAGGVAPETPVLRVEADNCLTEIQVAKLSGKFCKIKTKHPRTGRTQEFDIELRDSDLDLEFR